MGYLEAVGMEADGTIEVREVRAQGGVVADVLRNRAVGAHGPKDAWEAEQLRTALHVRGAA